MIVYLYRFWISIHAPTRGATVEHPAIRVSRIISIHAPTRGATQEPLFHQVRQQISIHAPTRGATFYDVNHCITKRNFNPRSHEGSDRALPLNTVLSWIFQSTLPRGERREWKMSEIKLKQFQSTLPRGERQESVRANQAKERFQSTLPRGERLLQRTSRVTARNFNPRSHEGSDSYVPALYAVNTAFQSTLPRGERHGSVLIFTNSF